MMVSGQAGKKIPHQGHWETIHILLMNLEVVGESSIMARLHLISVLNPERLGLEMETMKAIWFL